MKKAQKNIVLLAPFAPVERKIILDSMVASFRIEGICISRERAEFIYARVNERLKRQIR